MALIGLMQERLVERQRVVTSEELAEAVAVGQVLPGPVAVDAATHIGYRLRGLAGAVVATGGVVLPAFVIMLVLSPLYIAYGKIPQAEMFFRGARAAVIAVVAAVCVRMGGKILKGKPQCVIAGLVFVLAVACRTGPGSQWVKPYVPVEAFLVAAAAVFGIVLCPPGADPAPRGGPAAASAEGRRDGEPS